MWTQQAQSGRNESVGGVKLDWGGLSTRASEHPDLFVLWYSSNSQYFQLSDRFATLQCVRSILAGLVFVIVGSFNAPAGVLYSFSQPASGSGLDGLPAINFDFTVPSLLTNSTLIPASDINSPLIHYLGLDLSVLSVTIDPGLDSQAPYVGSRGVGDIIIKTGLGSQVVFSEGICFDSNTSCYSTLSPVGAQAFDQFGTYTHGDISLTISSNDPAQTAAPEPRFETAAGFLLLLTAVAMAGRSCHSFAASTDVRKRKQGFQQLTNLRPCKLV